MRRISKAKILYFLMGAAAATFVAADVIAEFDKDPNTRTATSFVKEGGKKSVFALLGTAGFCLWLGLHFLWPGFPL